MNVLIVGGAGYVGSIIRPALEQAHTCRYLDLRPVPGAEDRTVVGDINDPDVVGAAVEGQQALIYLAMGTADGRPKTSNDLDAAFNVNVRGFYRTLTHALEAGVSRIYLASTLSVYRGLTRRKTKVDEDVPPDAWSPYGISKRLGECICEAAAQQYPDATILALRLMHPRSEEDWPADGYQPDKNPHPVITGPEDVRRLFLKALEFDRPGYHVIQASGEYTETRLPNRRARELLDWSPENR